MFPTFTAAAEFRGQMRQWTLQVRDGTLEFWDATRAEPDQWRFAVWHPVHRRDVAAWTHGALENLWRDAIKRGNVGRRVELSDELTLFLRDGKSSFLRFNGKHRAVRRQTSVFVHGLFDRSNRELKQSLESNALSCYEGDFGAEICQMKIPFALDLDGYRNPTREELHLNYARGDEHELEKVNQWAWKLDPNWIDGVLSRSKVEDVALQIIVRPDEAAKVIFGAIDKNWGFRDVEHPRVALWNEITRFFEISPDETAHREQLDAGTRLFRLLLGPHPDWEHFDFNTNGIRQYSAHQQFELRLPLRDGLRKRAGLSDERIAELLF